MPGARGVPLKESIRTPLEGILGGVMFIIGGTFFILLGMTSKWANDISTRVPPVIMGVLLVIQGTRMIYYGVQLKLQRRKNGKNMGP